MKLLIIEDNELLLEFISELLGSENFLCEKASDFFTAHEKISMYNYDIVVIDINLPCLGLEIIKELKKINSRAGVIVISARNSLQNKIEGLNLGADDYLTKPFDISELIARVKALIRRRNLSGSDIVTIGGITINTDSREVFVQDSKIDLTRSEFDILLYFFSNPGRVITRESLAEHIWGDNMDLADSFDFIYSHIKNLRKKLAVYLESDPIKAVYGIGYKFDVPREL